MTDSLVARVALPLALGLAVAVGVRFVADAGGAPADQIARDQMASGRFVSERDFRGVGESSPAATVLRWWESIQARAPTAAVQGFFASRARRPLDRIRADLAVTRYIFALSKPLVVDQQVSGDTARVFALMPPPGEQVTTSKGTLYAFDLVREQGRWKLADDFLAKRATAERQFAARRVR
jgi:hypothetical protein